MRGCIMRMLSAELCNEDYQSLEMAAKELDRTVSRCGDKLRWPEPGHFLSVGLFLHSWIAYRKSGVISPWQAQLLGVPWMLK